MILQSKLNDFQFDYDYEDVKKEYFPNYKLEELLEEVGNVFIPKQELLNKKMPFQKCNICSQNKSLPEFFKYRKKENGYSEICKLCFRKASYGID